MGVRSCREGCYHDNAQYLPRARHNEAGTLESNFADLAVFGGGRFILSRCTGCILTGNKGCNSYNIIIIVSNVTHLRSTVHFCGRLSKHNGKPIEQTKKKFITESNMPVALDGSKAVFCLFTTTALRITFSTPGPVLLKTQEHDLRLCFGKL